MRQQEKKTGPEIFACLPSWPCLPVSLPAHPLFWNHGSQAKQIRLSPDGSQPPYHRIRLTRRFPKNSQVLSQYYSVYISPFCVSLSQRMLPDRFVFLIIWFVPESNFLPPLCLPKFAVSMPGFDCRVFHRKIGRSRLQSFSQLDHATQSIPPRTGNAASPRIRLRQGIGGSSNLGAEKRRAFFLPSCCSSVRIRATSCDRASIRGWVGQAAVRMESSRKTAVWSERRRSNRSIAISSSLQSCCVGVGGSVVRICGREHRDGFSRFSSSMDNFCSGPQFKFHDLLPVSFTVEPVVSALHSLRRGVGNALSAVRPTNPISITLHQSDELFFVRRIPHTLINGVYKAELPALALGGRTVFPSVHTVGSVLSLFPRKNRESIFHTQFI